MSFSNIYKENYLPDNIEWKNIEGLETKYQVSNYGHVKRLFRIHINNIGKKHTYTEKIFYPKPINNDETYYNRISYGLNRDFTHRLVAKTFLKNPFNLPEVNHKEGNKKYFNFAGTYKNNYEDGNLEWCNRKQNMEHASKNGLLNRDSEKRKEAVRKNQKISIEKNKEPVLMYDTDGNYLAQFESMKMAGHLLNIEKTNISRSCRKEGFTAGGFIWKYKNKK